jgi:probable RcsB/C two-component-system connector
MKSNRNKTLGEILIGEAALALLDEKTPVSWTGVLEKLEARLADEQDESRAGVLKAAIQDVRTEMKRRGSGADSNDEGQVATLYNDQERLTRH